MGHNLFQSRIQIVIAHSINPPNIRTMKNKRLKRTGFILILAGMIGVIITTAGMIGAFRKASSTGPTLSSEDYAKDIVGVLLPAEIGSPLILIGLVLVIVGWWRSRKEKQLALGK